MNDKVCVAVFDTITYVLSQCIKNLKTWARQPTPVHEPTQTYKQRSQPFNSLFVSFLIRFGRNVPMSNVLIPTTHSYKMKNSKTPKRKQWKFILTSPNSVTCMRTKNAKWQHTNEVDSSQTFQCVVQERRWGKKHTKCAVIDRKRNNDDTRIYNAYDCDGPQKTKLCVVNEKKKTLATTTMFSFALC